MLLAALHTCDEVEALFFIKVLFFQIHSKQSALLLALFYLRVILQMYFL